MSTRNAPWWIVLLLWMGLSTYWHVCKIKELCEAPVPTAVAPESAKANPLSLRDADSLYVVAEGNFGFVKSGAEADLSLVRAELDSLAGYLLAHPGKPLTIGGYYTSTETNATSYADLGIARAEAIKQYLVSQGVAAGEIFTVSEQLDSLPLRADSLRGGGGFTFRKPISATD